MTASQCRPFMNASTRKIPNPPRAWMVEILRCYLFIYYNHFFGLAKGVGPNVAPHM